MSTYPSPTTILGFVVFGVCDNVMLNQVCWSSHFLSTTKDTFSCVQAHVCGTLQQRGGGGGGLVKLSGAGVISGSIKRA